MCQSFKLKQCVKSCKGRWLWTNAGDIDQHFFAGMFSKKGVTPTQCEWVHIWVILVEKSQEGFLVGFGIFWKKKKFFFQFIYSRVLC